ncbi:MAG: hypothetical protein HC915_16715 [Anaerolineae bacterium]|nr:hypothetical protein [Anaerolineae bacterium]
MNTPKTPHHQLMYGWALDAQGYPVPIRQAVRDAKYFCPVCRGEMVPKMGDIKQHHFAHLSLVDCSPDNVARLVAGRWLVRALQAALEAGQPVQVTWQTRDTQESHTINLLEGVTTVHEQQAIGEDRVEIALLDAEGNPRVAILTGIQGTPPPEMVQRLTQAQIMVLLLNPVGVRSGQINLQELMAQATVWGGWWRLAELTEREAFLTEPEAVREILRGVAIRPPYRFYGALHEEGSLRHVLEVDGRKVWLPQEVWMQTVGGTLNRLSPLLTIIQQEWTEDNQATIALYYVQTKDSSAVAIRYFGPGQPVVSNLTSAFRLNRLEARDVAEQLAGGAITYPR